MQVDSSCFTDRDVLLQNLADICESEASLALRTQSLAAFTDVLRVYGGLPVKSADSIKRKDVARLQVFVNDIAKTDPLTTASKGKASKKLAESTEIAVLKSGVRLHCSALTITRVELM